MTGPRAGISAAREEGRAGRSPRLNTRHSEQRRGPPGQPWAGRQCGVSEDQPHRPLCRPARGPSHINSFSCFVFRVSIAHHRSLSALSTGATPAHGAVLHGWSAFGDNTEPGTAPAALAFHQQRWRPRGRVAVVREAGGQGASVQASACLCLVLSGHQAGNMPWGWCTLPPPDPGVSWKQV